MQGMRHACTQVFSTCTAHSRARPQVGPLVYTVYIHAHVRIIIMYNIYIYKTNIHMYRMHIRSSITDSYTLEGIHGKLICNV